MKAALYIRLSREDDRDGPSESVTNQKALLTGYAAEQQIDVYDIYIDDGYSGGNFDRPAFRRLLRDIEANQVDTVITKDLSRLGRDYILTGHYLERYFPEHRVRYISLLDGIDTGLETSANDITPFRAIMNDLYAKDISKKIKSVKREKQRNGQFIGSKAPFGYRKDPLNKNHLLVEETTASIVRRIFHMAENGESCRSIARQLSFEGIPPPSQYGTAMEKASCFTAKWSSERISEMLQNEVYIGNMVQGRRVKSSYKSQKILRQSREHWVIVENTHEPIINRDSFDTVQRLIASRRHTRNRTYDNPLKGLIFCHECGHPLGLINRKSVTGEDTLYLLCRTHQRFSQDCTPHCMKLSAVTEAVSELVRTVCLPCVTPQELLSLTQAILQENDKKLQGGHLSAVLSQKINTLTAQMDTLYLDHLNGIIAPEDFTRLYTRLSEERRNLQTQRETTIVSPAPAMTADAWVSTFQESIGTDRAILTQLIHRIELTKEKEVIVYFRFSSPSQST